MNTASGWGRRDKSASRKLPIWILMPGVPWRRAFCLMMLSHSGRISNASICRWGKCNRASMDMLPVQKPISHSTWWWGRSSAWRVNSRMGILVIIFSRPSNKAKSESGIPYSLGGSCDFVVESMMQLGCSNVCWVHLEPVEMAASVRERLVTFSLAGLPKCSPTCIV